MPIEQDLLQLPRNAKKLIFLAADAVFLSGLFYLAYRLKVGIDAVQGLNNLVFGLAALTALPVFIRVGLYRAVIRYMGTKALYAIIKAVSIAALILAGVMASFAQGLLPHSVLLIYWALAVLYVGGSRFLVRDYIQGKRHHRHTKERVAIYGAGSSGVELAAGLMSGREYQPVCFIDEKGDLVDTLVKGIRVYNPDRLPLLIKQMDFTQVLLAIPSASRARRREILAQLEPLPVHVRTIPGLADLVSGVAQVDDIQEVDIADLLGRDPVPPNVNLLAKCITAKSVMVTGAGGSIGSELCRQIIMLHPSRIVLFEASEYALYKVERELDALRKANIGLRHIEIQCVLGSVTHRRRVESVIRSFSVNTIYHAAAYKHVPLVEHNPIEGVQNNLFGTWRTAEAALAAGVETFVLISTDKAVRPTNVMGATKRMAELVLQGMATRSKTTRFCMVRFGNVLDSSGSVVPLFRQQIRNGGPVTVTHSEITRYFMTIPEAAQLVLQAGSMGKGGEVFVLDMGESVKIADLARRMIKLSGLEVLDTECPSGDIEIVYTGLRPGEKLYEELLIGDNVSGTEHPRIMRVMESEMPWADLAEILQSLDKGCIQFNSEKVRGLLQSAVSGYLPQCEIVDPVWIQLASNEKLRELAAVAATVSEIPVQTRAVN